MAHSRYADFYRADSQVMRKLSVYRLKHRHMYFFILKRMTE